MQTTLKQRGAAIVVALFVTALVAAAAVAMITRLQTDMRRTALILHENDAYFAAQGSVAWAMDQLNQNVKTQQRIDHLPLTSPQEHVQNLLLSSTLSDAQGKFNLNNLSDLHYRETFLRLIQLASPTTSRSDAENILLATLDWISPGIRQSAFDGFYSKKNPAYCAAHRPMVSISELRLVKGITPTLFNQLEPYITALPVLTPININQAPSVVLASLSRTMTLESAKAIENTRQQTPFLTLEQFFAFDIVKNNPIERSIVTLMSDYFLVETHVTVAQQSLTLYTLLQRSVKDSKSSVNILWQSKGTL